MKMKSIIWSTAVFIAAVSCAQLEPSSDYIPVLPEGKYIIYAHAPETRTSLDAATGTVKWQTNDAIKVAVRNSTTDSDQLAVFNNIEAEGISATFEGISLPSHEDIVAIYPASSYKGESASGSHILIPSEQIATADGFPTDTEGKSVNPSYAYCASENEEGKVVMNFKNIAGLFGVEVPEYLENITSITIESAGNAISGEFNLKVTDADNAVLDVKQGNAKVTLTPSAGSKVFAPGKYYAVLAPGAYTGLKITLATAVGGRFERTSENMSFTIVKSSRQVLKLSKLIPAPVPGDYFLYDGTWAPASKNEINGMVDGKKVIGYVFSNNASRVSEEVMSGWYNLSDVLSKRTQATNYIHGYVLSKDIAESQWHKDPQGADAFGMSNVAWAILSNAEIEKYNFFVYELSANETSINYGKMYGFVNTSYFKSGDKGEVLLAKNVPACEARNSSGWYVPSTGDMQFIKAEFEKPENNIDFNRPPFDSYVNREIWTSSTSRKYDFWNGTTNYSVLCNLSVENGKLVEKYNFQRARDNSHPVFHMLVF